jgi:N-alpha-acetyltransferase 35, NatC auxiliary subunit
LSNHAIVKQLIDSFLTKCSQVFASLVQIIGNNRARQREKLGFIIEDFSTLQEEATSLDHILNTMLIQQKSQNLTNSSYRTWIVYNNLIIMTNYLLYGFELDLYSNYEYHYVYWYLGEMLYTWQISNLNQVDQCLSLGAILNSESGKKDKNKSKKKGKTTLEKDIQLIYGHRFMSRAYYAAMKAFAIEKKICEPSEEFNDEELRFQNRFSPFKAFSNYAQFKDRDLQFLHEYNKNPSRIYLSAQELFEKAKNVYEELNDFNLSSTCAKIAKINFVVMRLLSSGLKRVDQLELDFSTHPHYPIMRI